jgi:hypothetical protein
VKQKLSCPCGSVFTVNFDEEMDIDANPSLFTQIMDGSFLNFTCANCGKKHKPEFPFFLSWPLKKIRFEVLPELDRGEYARRKKDPAHTETIIGYHELADRLAVLNDELEPVVIEALKYYLLVRAEETYPELKISAWYHKVEKDSEGKNACIEFHLHGIKPDEIAVSRIPWDLYQKNLDEYRKKPRSELFSSLKRRTYLSVNNMVERLL